MSEPFDINTLATAERRLRSSLWAERLGALKTLDERAMEDGKALSRIPEPETARSIPLLRHDESGSRAICELATDEILNLA